jgi:antitoxin (DNA-binding transcriptional repressor) of toxin-antitoxin stability system
MKNAGWASGQARAAAGMAFFITDFDQDFQKTVEITDATAPLSDYARKTGKEALIVMRKGRPVAALMPLDAHTGLENLVVTTHPTFRAIIERSAARYKAEGRTLDRASPTPPCGPAQCWAGAPLATEPN